MAPAKIKKPVEVAEEMLSQCEECGAVEFKTKMGMKWQQSIAIFEKLPKKTCPSCNVKDKHE